MQFDNLYKFKSEIPFELIISETGTIAHHNIASSLAKILTPLRHN